MNEILAQERVENKDVKIYAVGSNIGVQISEFKGKKRIDIRKWWKNQETNKWLRSKNGLNILLDEWDYFVSNIKEIDAFVRKNIE